jgi:hypothetical protein
MFLKLALSVLLILTFSGCSTTKVEPVKPVISDEIRVACEPLPELKAEVGKDMRQALLKNRAESVAVHETCAARHRGALRAVGVEPISQGAKPDRWAEFNRQLELYKLKGKP